MINKLDSKNLHYKVRFETRCPLLSPSSLGLIFCPLHSPEIAELLQGVQKSPKLLTAPYPSSFILAFIEARLFFLKS